MTNNRRIPDKPFKTFKEQVDSLHKRNLIIENISQAERILQFASYYDLINGYKEIFMEGDRFKEGISFNYIYAFSVLDKSFQSILLKYSVYVERSFKNTLAHRIAEKFSVFEDEYLNTENYIRPYHQTKKFYRTFKEINKVINDEFVQSPTAHYKTNKNHIPPWILFKNLSFSTCIDLARLLPNSIKKTLSEELINYEIDSVYKSELVFISLILVRRFRNVIAHNYKFISFHTDKTRISNRKLGHQFSLFYENLSSEHKSGNNRYAMLISLVLLLNDNTVLAELYQDLTVLEFKYSSTIENKRLYEQYLTLIGLPIDYLKRFNLFLSDLYQ